MRYRFDALRPSLRLDLIVVFAYPVFPQAPGTLLGFLITSKVLGSVAVAANH